MCNEPSRWNRPQAGGYKANERRHQQLRLTRPPPHLQQIHLRVFRLGIGKQMPSPDVEYCNNNSIDRGGDSRKPRRSHKDLNPGLGKKVLSRVFSSPLSDLAPAGSTTEGKGTTPMKTHILSRIAAFTSALLAIVVQPMAAQDYSTASAINNHGQIVGGSLLDDLSAFDAFSLNKQGATNFGTFGGFASLAYAVNDQGSVIGQSDTAEYNEFGEPISVGFLANRSGVHSIGSLPGLENSQPFAINSRGIIVGRAYNNAEDPSRPFD